MTATIPDAPELVTPGDLGDELASFVRAMRAANVSPNTILAYGGAVRQFGTWLMAHDHPTNVGAIEPRHLHAHDFRHAATHHELAGGMNEADVMSKRGWDSPAMLRRYASTTANERAILASRKLGLGDKL